MRTVECCDNTGQSCNTTYGEVNTASHDYKSHAQCDKAELRIEIEYAEDGDRIEIVVADETEGQNNDERDERTLLLQKIVNGGQSRFDLHDARGCSCRL